MNKEYQNSAFQLIDKLVNKEWNKKRSASRAIGMNSRYHAPMADYLLLHKLFHIQSMVHSTPIVNQY